MDKSQQEFHQHVLLLRSGDKQSTDSFVAKYEPFIRRSLRLRIQRASLQAAADSVDICQSVLGSFLLRLTAGEYDLQSEMDLRRLLTSIANKKFLMFHRRELAAKRDRSQTHPLGSVPEVEGRRLDDPSFRLQQHELALEVAKRFSEDERELFHRRRNGEAWTEIGQSLQIDPAVLRKRLSRAVKRVAIELGFETAEEGTEEGRLPSPGDTPE